MKITGLAAYGSIYKDDTADLIQPRQVSIQGIDVHRNALDILNRGYYSVGTDAVEAGSTSKRIVAAAHGLKAGDAIRVLTTANGIVNYEMSVAKVIDANTFELDAIAVDINNAQVDFAVGDTFEVLRGVTPAYTSSGATVTGPMQILRGPGGVYTATDITKDTTVSGNTIAMPVEIVGASGVEINITAGDINVQLTHTGANPDSTQIGDGTEVWSINTANEGEVSDSGVRTNTGNIDGKMTAYDLDGGAGTENVQGVNLRISQGAGPSIEAKGQQGSADSIPVVLSTPQETLLTNMSTSLGDLDDALDGGARQLRVDIIDRGGIATETTLSTMSGKLPTTLGQQGRADSMSVTHSTEDLIVHTAIKDALELLDDALDGGARQLRVDIIDRGGIATETTLANVATDATLSTMSGKLPLTLGSKPSADSLSVTLASDQALNTNQYTPVELVDQDLSGVTTGADTSIIAVVSAQIRALDIFCSTGISLIIRVDPAGGTAYANYAYIPPGGLPGKILPISIPAGAQVAIRGLSGNGASGQRLIANFLG